MQSFHTLPSSIYHAAILLDKVMPGWASKINEHKLNMSNCKLCILGQLYGDYQEGNKQLFGQKISARAANNPFGSVDSVGLEQWKIQIQQRLKVQQENRFVTPVVSFYDVNVGGLTRRLSMSELIVLHKELTLLHKEISEIIEGAQS